MTRRPDPSEPMCALAFKTRPILTWVVSVFRVYSGELKAGSYIQRPFGQERAYLSSLPDALNKQNPKESIGTGDIGAGVGFRDIRTGDTLCDENHPILLEAIDFPDPVIGIAVEPKTQKDLDRLSTGLLNWRKRIHLYCEE